MKRALLTIFAVFLPQFVVGAHELPLEQPNTKEGEEVPEPRNLEEAMAALEIMVPQGTRRQIIEGKIEAIDMHFGLGMHVRNRWGLWKESALTTYFKKLGVTHPDGMSCFILQAYCLRLQNKPHDALAVIRSFAAEDPTYLEVIPVGREEANWRHGAVLYRQFEYNRKGAVVATTLIWHPDTAAIYLKRGRTCRLAKESEVEGFQKQGENWLFDEDERKLLETFKTRTPEQRLEMFKSMDEQEAWKFSGLFEVSDEKVELRQDPTPKPLPPVLPPAIDK